MITSMNPKKISVYFLSSLVITLFAAFSLFSCSSPESPSVEVGGNPSETTAETSTEVNETSGFFETNTEEDTKTEEETKTEDIVTKEPVFVPGMDVSRWQGTIDWKKVKDAGIKFAMIRIGAYSDGGYALDSKAVYNLQQAEKHGVLAGVYFYSGAKIPQDARKEAQWVLEQIEGFAISYPVVLDWEMDSYKKDVTAAVRTDTALAFLGEIENAGYEAMLYTQQLDFESGEMWQKDRILGKYPVWVARYSQEKYPEALYPEGNDSYAMWQYSDQGKIDGISGNVDLNVAYFEREYTPPKNTSLRPTEVDTPVDFKQTFEKVNIRLTAKDEVNLRKTPSTEGEKVGLLKKGEFLECTGISDMGWARLIYQGKEVYAVYSYLSEKVVEEAPDPAPGHSFQTVSEEVTAKEEVNLRSSPTTGEENVVGTLLNGEYILRTGIGDKGWDRLEYQGKTVFAVSSMLLKKENS